jgi:hypothetical protein
VCGASWRGLSREVPVEVIDTPGGRERRREPRTVVDEPAVVRLLNYPERGWGACRFADVSDRGAGLILFGPPWPRYRFELSLLISPSAGVATCDAPLGALEVIVRNASATVEGLLRVGVEFVTLTQTQQSGADRWVCHLLGDNRVLP